MLAFYILTSSLQFLPPVLIDKLFSDSLCSNSWERKSGWHNCPIKPHSYRAVHGLMSLQSDAFSWQPHHGLDMSLGYKTCLSKKQRLWGKQFPEGEADLIGIDQHPGKKVFINAGFHNIEPMFLYIRNNHGKCLLLVLMSLAGSIHLRFT